MKFTDIIVLLDRSSSMYRTRKETIESFNAFITSQQALESEDEVRLTLLQFAGPADRSYTYRNHPIKLAGGLTDYTYSPMGASTALRDAMKGLIDERGAEYASLPAESRPSQVVFVVITDGEDNASRTSPATLRALVERQSNTYSWKFEYLGAGHDAITVAKEYGFNYGNTIEYSAEKINLVSRTFSEKLSGLRSTGIYASYTADQRKEVK